MLRFLEIWGRIKWPLHRHNSFGTEPSAVALSTVSCWMLLSGIIITVICKCRFYSKDWSDLKMRYVHSFYIYVCVLILQSVIQSDTCSFPLFCMAVAVGFRAEEKKELLISGIYSYVMSGVIWWPSSSSLPCSRELVSTDGALRIVSSCMICGSSVFSRRLTCLIERYSITCTFWMWVWFTAEFWSCGNVWAHSAHSCAAVGRVDSPLQLLTHCRCR